MKTGIKRNLKPAINPQKSMATWSRVIETYEALPEIYHTCIHQLQAETGEMPYIVLTPSDNFYYKSAETVVCSTPETLYILESQDKKLCQTIFAIEQIRDIEIGAVLLYSWLTIHGRDPKGTSLSKTLAFNSVSSPHFLPFINLIRQAPEADEISENTLTSEKNKFEYLVSTTFKFMNYGRRCLKGSDHVSQILWEPEIREQIFSKLGFSFHRTLAYAHLLVLTDQELIVIREDELSPLVRGNRYGGIWRYIPHRSLRSLHISERSNGLVDLEVVLDGEEKIPLLFRPENRSQAEELANRLEDAIQSPINALI